MDSLPPHSSKEKIGNFFTPPQQDVMGKVNEVKILRIRLLNFNVYFPR